MKKALIASLIAYFTSILTIIALMITYMIVNGTSPKPDMKPFFNAVVIAFVVFLAIFIIVSVLLIIYPKVLKKYYYSKLKPIIDSHKAKYGDLPTKTYVFYEKTKVYVSFIMGEEKDTYTFELKETPMSRNEPSKMVSNIMIDIYGRKIII